MSTADWTVPRPAAADGLERWRARLAEGWLHRALWLAPLVALTVFAIFHRFRAMGAPLWIDEGISLGIASHPFTAIPHVLREDGSPPLYYLALHVWTSVFGSTGTHGHQLSALFAVLGVPAAAWAAWRPWGALAGVIAAALAAFSPFLGLYADELRMYSLTFLLAALGTGAFVRAYVVGSRRWAVGFGVITAALMLTHGWGVFFAASAAVAYALALAFAPAERRRAMLVDGAIAFVVVAVLFAAWIPTFIFQAKHTGAPWSHVPHLNSLPLAFTRMLGGFAATGVLGALAVLGGALVLWRGTRAQRLAFAAGSILAVGTLVGGFLASRFGTPAWASRYHTIVLGALVVPLAAGLSRLKVAGLLAALVVCVPLWALKPTDRTLDRKSNVILLAHRFAGKLPRGTLVVSTQPDEVPVLRYYLGPGYRYLTPLGPQRDDGVVNWVDALHRARTARISTLLAPAAAALRPGQRLLLVGPRFGHTDAPWTKVADGNEIAWRTWLRHRRDLTIVGEYTPRHLYSRATVTGLLFVKRAPRPARRGR